MTAQKDNDRIATIVEDIEAAVERYQQPLTYQEAVDRYMRTSSERRPEPVASLSELRGTTWHLANDDGPCAEVSLVGDVKVLNWTFAERYWDWCCDNNRLETLGHYGPEVRIRIDVPLDDIVRLMREAGVEVTFERVEALLSDLQQNNFDDKHGGCPADGGVKEYILGAASNTIAFWEQDGLFEECYPTGNEADDEGAADPAPESH